MRLWIEGHAAHAPDAVALRSPDERIPYTALQARIAAMAALLAAEGIGPGDRVAFLGQNPTPTDDDIDAGITNICRCGTFARIRTAIHAAARAATPNATSEGAA